MKCRFLFVLVTNGGASLFSVDETSGDIKLTSPLDYETATSYLISVKATDGGANTVRIQVTYNFSSPVSQGSGWNLFS